MSCQTPPASARRARSLRNVLAVAAGVVLFAALPASSDTIAPGQEGELLNFLPPQPGKHICYSRAYSADHLAKHPQQKVTYIEFRLAYHRFEPDQFFPEGQRNYYFEALARVRGKGRLLKAFGECSPQGGKISCGVDCDGGGLVVKRTDKPGQILVDLTAYGHLRMTEGCGEDEDDYVDLEPGADDKTFLLTQTAGSCPAYESW